MHSTVEITVYGAEVPLFPLFSLSLTRSTLARLHCWACVCARVCVASSVRAYVLLCFPSERFSIILRLPHRREMVILSCVCLMSASRICRFAHKSESTFGLVSGYEIHGSCRRRGRDREAWREGRGNGIMNVEAKKNTSNSVASVCVSLAQRHLLNAIDNFYIVYMSGSS